MSLRHPYPHTHRHTLENPHRSIVVHTEMHSGFKHMHSFVAVVSSWVMCHHCVESPTGRTGRVQKAGDSAKSRGVVDKGARDAGRRQE